MIKGTIRVRQIGFNEIVKGKKERLMELHGKKEGVTMKTLIGILIIVIGFLFLLNNMGMIEHELDSILALWPLIIVGIGLKITVEGLWKSLITLKCRRIKFVSILFGLVITGIGMSFLGDTTGWFDFSLSELWNWTWPVLIIYIGFKLVFNRGDWVNINITSEFEEFDSDFFKGKKQMIGDVKLGKTPWKVKDNQLKLGIGEMKVDFTTAILEPGVNELELTAGIGSVELILPKDVPVHLEASVRVGDMNILGDKHSGTGRAITYTSPDYQEAEEKLKIKVRLLVGEVGVYAVN